MKKNLNQRRMKRKIAEIRSILVQECFYIALTENFFHRAIECIVQLRYPPGLPLRLHQKLDTFHHLVHHRLFDCSLNSTNFIVKREVNRRNTRRDVFTVKFDEIVVSLIDVDGFSSSSSGVLRFVRRFVVFFAFCWTFLFAAAVCFASFRRKSSSFTVQST